jgi:hypothetical protein
MSIICEKFDIDESGCWTWIGSITHHKGTYGKWDHTSAQRAVYLEAGLDIPEGHELDHLCLNTLCVNPDHLEPVTPEENRRRRYAAITECKSGHPYDDENTYIRPTGQRDCRACIRSRVAAYQARKRVAA